MTIAVDFDGTIVEYKYPKIGEEIPFAVETLKMLQQERGLVFWAVNRDYPEETVDNNPHFSRKLKADMFIDDRNLGGLADWGTLYSMIKHHRKWRHMIDDEANSNMYHRPRKKHWWNF